MHQITRKYHRSYQSAKNNNNYYAQWLLVTQPPHPFRFNSSTSIPYSGKLSRENTFANWWRTRIRGETFVDCLVLPIRCGCDRRFSPRKLSRIDANPQNLRKFSPSIVSRYTVSGVQYAHLLSYM